jgi:uncharacterized RDD family membrane protein YckC
MAALPMPGKPAGFWLRSAAWCLDWLLLSPLLYVALRPGLSDAAAQFQGLRAQLENWMLAQSWQADSALGLWLDLSTRMLADPALQAQLTQATLRLCAGLTWTLVLASLLAAVYFIAFEASPWQATPGKRWLGLRVIAVAGGPVGVSRAAARFFAGSLSWLSLNLGHALAMFRRDGRALHDLIAGTAVVVFRPVA